MGYSCADAESVALRAAPAEEHRNKIIENVLVIHLSSSICSPSTTHSPCRRRSSACAPVVALPYLISTDVSPSHASCARAVFALGTHNFLQQPAQLHTIHAIHQVDSTAQVYGVLRRQHSNASARQSVCIQHASRCQARQIPHTNFSARVSSPARSSLRLFQALITEKYQSSTRFTGSAAVKRWPLTCKAFLMPFFERR